MRGWVRQFHTPLLAKELIEQAARRRTYTLRTVYAVILFVFCLLMLQGILRQSSTPAAVLGTGQRIFGLVVGAQLVAILLFMPAMTATAITQERERNSLELLLTTTMTPWDIVLQKLVSRLIPLATLLMLALPLLGVAYAFGGLSSNAVWTAAYLLMLTAVQLGAITLLVTVEAESTSNALLNCYVRVPMHMIGLALLSGVGLVCMAPCLFAFPLLFDEGLIVFPPIHFMGSLLVAPQPLYITLLLSIPALLVTWLYLRTAVRRLEVIATLNPAIEKRERFTLAHLPEKLRKPGMRKLPDKEPVAWRQEVRPLLAQMRRVFWVFLLLDLPAFIILAMGTDGSLPVGSQSNIGNITCSAWFIWTLILALMAADPIAYERSHQTLDVLLTTPMSTRSLFDQMNFLSRRMSRGLYLALVVMVVAEAVVEYSGHRSGNHHPAMEVTMYIIFSLLAGLILLPLARWVGTYIGLRVRSRIRAILMILGLAVLLVFLLPITLSLISEAAGSPALDRILDWVRLLNPAGLIGHLEWASDEWASGEDDAWISVYQIGFILSLYAGLLWLLRRWCLRHADFYLGRAEAEGGQA